MITAFTRVFFVRIIGTTEIPVIMITSIIAGIIIPIMFYNTATRLGATWLFTLRPETKPVAQVPKQEPTVSVGRFSKQEPTREMLENITGHNR